MDSFWKTRYKGNGLVMKMQIYSDKQMMETLLDECIRSLTCINK